MAIDTSNLDSGADKVKAARPAILEAVQKINELSNLSENLAASSGASMVGFSHANNYAVGTLGAKAKQVVSVKDAPFNAKGDGVADDTAAINAAIDAVGQAGGGIVYLPPGTYLVSNSNPSATNWDNRRAIFFKYSNVHLKGAGRGATVLYLANGANSHVIKFGVRVETTPVQVADCSVAGLTINGNRANQVIPTDTSDHNGGIDVSSGCTGITLHDMHVKQTSYYGIGFQNADFSDCTISKVLVEDAGADGIDWKDNNATNIGNVIEYVIIKRFGLVTALTLQGGINFRGGVTVRGATVLEYSGDRHGIRFDQSTTAGAAPSKLSGFYCKPSSVDTTVGVYLNIVTDSAEPDCMVEHGHVYGAQYGVDVRWRFGKVSNVVARACETGFRVYGDSQLTNVTARNCTVTGYKVTNSTNVFANASAYNCAVGADIDAASSLSSFRGGVFSNNTTNVTDNGTQTAFSQVSGINTHSVGTADVPIDSTGTKTVTIAHNLSFTPSLDDVVLTFKRKTNVGDFSLGFFWVYNADATNVYCNVRVLTASATAGATITLVANCMAKKALRQ